jgi:hypothetical protein
VRGNVQNTLDLFRIRLAHLSMPSRRPSSRVVRAERPS